ncbi:hypothetical protein KIPB_007545, partial [Kipferlia bialata]
ARKGRQPFKSLSVLLMGTGLFGRSDTGFVVFENLQQLRLSLPRLQTVAAQYVQFTKKRALMGDTEGGSEAEGEGEGEEGSEAEPLKSDLSSPLSLSLSGSQRSISTLSASDKEIPLCSAEMEQHFRLKEPTAIELEFHGYNQEWPYLEVMSDPVPAPNLAVARTSSSSSTSTVHSHSHETEAEGEGETEGEERDRERSAVKRDRDNDGGNDHDRPLVLQRVSSIPVSPTINPELVVKNVPYTFGSSDMVDLLHSLIPDQCSSPNVSLHMSPSRQFTGMVFLTFTSSEEALYALLKLNKTRIGGRRLRTEFKRVGATLERIAALHEHALSNMPQVSGEGPSHHTHSHRDRDRDRDGRDRDHDRHRDHQSHPHRYPSGRYQPRYNHNQGQGQGVY